MRAYRRDDGDVLIELQPDFEVGPGPNFWVYLNTRGGVDDEADFEADGGRQPIRAPEELHGSQVYRTSADAFEAAGALTISCESFGQYIASADR